jgi:ABC-type cobalamin transport system ATPase subunit
MFDPQELHELSVVDASTGEIVIAQDDDLDPRQRHDLYSRQLVADCQLENFAQLAFLQHFVLTFDERRDLLFWGPRTLPAALFIAFGLDPGKARRADTLQATARGADSLARNYSWQASDWRRQLENLEAAADEVRTEDDGIAVQHRALQDEREEAAAEAERVAGELAGAQLRISERSSQLRADRQRYDELWAERLRGHGHPSGHPVVTTTLQASRCALCGTAGEAVVEHISRALSDQHCPMCASQLSVEGNGNDERLAQLAELDAAIEGHQEAIEMSGRAAKALTHQLNAVRGRLDELARSLSEFERGNEVALLRAGAGDVSVVAERYRAAMADQLARKEEQLRRRNEARAELRGLQRDLVESYGVARDRFVPNFTRLAEKFLGMPLDIELATQRNDVSLQLSVRGDRRRAEDHLSESQRFFLDIALRMALVMEMSAPDAPGVLYVDTPEGSLDIAYEARAGNMFGSFVRDGYGLIMTANINTSKLLERLAERCGLELMALERMTDWTVLSEVQADEEELFDAAYRTIERALEHAG